MNAAYRREAGCPQRDSAEHEEYVRARSVGSQEVKEQDGADLLERILSRENPRKLGMPQWQAYGNGNSRKGYWAAAESGILTHNCIQKTRSSRILCNPELLRVSALMRPHQPVPNGTRGDVRGRQLK